MKDNLPNNLFTYATSELSQDAFIAWLLSWGKSDYKTTEPHLHKIAHSLIAKFFEKHSKSMPQKIKTIDVKTQDSRIDVLCILNDTWAIIIEDKIGTSDNRKKLRKYVQEMVNKDYEEDYILPIYFKTGDQSDYSEIEKAGYKNFNRSDFLGILKKGRELGIENVIYRDYLEYLQSIEDEVNSYAITPINNWTHRAWIGFLKEIKPHLKNDANWGYVPNQSGGFVGMWWHSTEEKGVHWYLQIEQEKLCFKIQVDEKPMRSKHRNDFHKLVIEQSKNSPLAGQIKKPDRFGYGKHMTAAVYRNYRSTDEKGIIDIKRTVANLNECEKILDRARTQMGIK